MESFPHHYIVNARCDASGDVQLDAEGLPALVSAPPREFDGPGDKWSPESLLVAAVADCFVLTFRAIAKASKLEWTRLFCSAAGTLDRVERVTRFTEIRLGVSLTIPEGVNRDAADRLLHKAEKNCLITNSLDLEVRLETDVSVEG